MVIIINELSLTGQFSPESFIKELPGLIKLFKAFDQFKVQLSKRTDFYDQKVVGNIGFREFITGAKADEISRLKSVLVPLTDKEPFWDLALKHSDKDLYVCAFTDQTWGYGLAESVETNQVVCSFAHEEFKADLLQLMKNASEVFSYNVKDIASFLNFLFTKHSDFNYQSIVPEKTSKTDFFPNRIFSNLMLNAEKIEEENAKLDQLIRIDNYKKAAPKIAYINLWQFCAATTNKNDRDIFKRRIQAGFCYLSIDTQHGRFELFDSKGEHISEYLFSGLEVPGSKRNRSISI